MATIQKTYTTRLDNVVAFADGVRASVSIIDSQDSSNVTAHLIIVVKDGKATVRPIDPSMVDVANEKSFSVRIFVPRAAKVKASISEIAKGMSQPGDLVHPVKAARIAACAGLMIDKATKKAVLRPPMIEGATTSRSL